MSAPQTEVLVFVEGREIARHILGPGAHTFGRSDACSICLEVAHVSRQHARLTVGADGSLRLEDLGSANGTFLDGQQITAPMAVAPNQSVQIGAATLLVQQSIAAAGNGDGMPPELSQVIRYEPGAEIAKGGMGAVFAARQPAIRREVALNVMLRDVSAHHRLRFIEEAQITGQLEHPNIVPVHDLALNEQGQPYYTMKLVKGSTLKDILNLLGHCGAPAAAKYPLAALLTIFQKVCDAVAFAHARGVVHRDLKPANIMVGEYGEVLVMDWGLAKIVGRDGDIDGDGVPIRPGSLGETTEPAFPVVATARDDQRDIFSTQDGAVMGTPQYMSPEQARGEVATLDQRSDIFSLGVILYEMVTLLTPFPGKTTREILAKIRRGQFVLPNPRLRSTDAPRPRHLTGRAIHNSLESVISKALTHDRDQRYQRVVEFQADLTAYQNGFATSAENAGTWRQIKLLVARHKVLSIVVATAFLLLVGITSAFTIHATGLLWEASKSDSEESLRKLELEGDWNTAVAYGARALRIRPGNAAAARRLFGRTLLAGVAPSRILPHEGPVTQAQFLSDGDALLTVADGHTVRRWDPVDGNRWKSQELFSVANGERIAALSPAGDRVCLLAADGAARLWDVSAGAVGTALGADKPSVVVFSPDGSQLLTMTGTGKVAIWDARTGVKVASLSSAGDAVTAAAIAPDASRILVGMKTGAVRCWKRPGNGEASDEKTVWNGKEFVRKHAGNPGGWEMHWTLDDALGNGVAEMTISPDGSRFSAVSGDGAAGSWSMSNHFNVASLKGEQAAVCMAYSADGSTVATGGVGGSVQLWERASGTSLASLRGHRSAITALSFSGDGRFLLSASKDGTARLWEMARCPLEAPEARPGEAADSRNTPAAPAWVYESLLPFLCGKELDREGKISELPVSRQLEAQTALERRIDAVRLQTGARATPWDRYLAWKFLSDPRTRPITPDSAVTVPEFVEKNLWNARKELADAATLRAVWLAAPGHPLVEWALGKSHAGGAWGGWLRDRALRRIADPAAAALYGAEAAARWRTARTEIDDADRRPGVVFTNSLGMKFVPVALSGGKSVLFSVWDTRVKDYAAYASAQAGVNGLWKDLVYKAHKVSPTEDCPVAAVSWEDANGFCKWLTAHERTLGKITARQRYRLPTDEEWSWAVGIGEEEEEALRGGSPKDKDQKVTAYPWGTLKYPPSDDQGKPLGNYADSMFGKAFSDFGVIPGFSDGYETSSPVGSFPANAHGLYDMGGNMWQWCEDWYDPGDKKSRVVRGASWNYYGSVYLLSSYRRNYPPVDRNYAIGFRCVLAEDVSAP